MYSAVTNNSTSYEFTYLDKGEVFAKADLSDMPKTKAKLKKRELAKARSKVSEVVPSMNLSLWVVYTAKCQEAEGQCQSEGQASGKKPLQVLVLGLYRDQ